MKRLAFPLLLIVTTRPGAGNRFSVYAGTKAVLVDANSGRYLEGLVLPGSDWR